MGEKNKGIKKRSEHHSFHSITSPTKTLNRIKAYTGMKNRRESGRVFAAMKNTKGRTSVSPQLLYLLKKTRSGSEHDNREA